MKSVTAPDDGAVVITCSKAKANMLSLWIPIIQEHIWSKVFAMSVFTTAQVNSWADSAWTDPAYDALHLQQQTTVELQQRKHVVWKMEEMLYKESPCIVLACPKDLEAWDVADWDAWAQSPPKVGDVFYTATNLGTYLYVHPKTAAATTGGFSTPWIAAIVVAVVAFLPLRRKPKAVEEQSQGTAGLRPCGA